MKVHDFEGSTVENLFNKFIRPIYIESKSPIRNKHRDTYPFMRLRLRTQMPRLYHRHVAYTILKSGLLICCTRVNFGAGEISQNRDARANCRESAMVDPGAYL
jgi:hypothetical protein